MQDLNDKITGNSLTAPEWNQMPTEIQNIIESFGILLSGADLNQLGKGLANYVSAGNFYLDAGVADAYSITVVGSRQSPTVYTNGMVVRFVPVADNLTTTPTVNVAGLGIKSIIPLGGGSVGVGDITSGSQLQLRFISGSDAFIMEDYAKDLRFDGQIKVIANLAGAIIQGLNSGLIIDGSSGTSPVIKADENKQLKLQSVITNEGGVGVVIEEIGTGSSLKPVFKTIRDTTDGAGFQLLKDDVVVMQTAEFGVDFNSAFVTSVFGLSIVGDTDIFAGVRVKRTDNTSGTFRNYFVCVNASGVTVGRINSNSSSTQYLTSSDYRLKSNPTPISRLEAFNLIKNLNPGMHTWLDDPSGGIQWSFLAHELQEHIPKAVSGKKDERDDEGNIVYQGVDLSVVVPYLTSALKHSVDALETAEIKIDEMQTQMDNMEARLTALEA